MSLETPGGLRSADVTEFTADPLAPADQSESSDPADARHAPPADRGGRGIRPWFGWAMFALAVAALAVDVVIYSVGDSQPVLGWTLLWVAIGLSGVAAVGGAVALIMGWGRIGGGIALVVGIAVNPGVFSAAINAATSLTPY
ncbi:hypothetical protein [Diaminobutyricimonas sp. TR449]|uniref:hypothetical protein n=1 Tax=Diaminobutyricimonas sp. TR449 TaxID=2708076 RepID=UPI00141F6B14|nr:hypothetical protein [Diaminobutyricimonas sp. TR449]